MQSSGKWTGEITCVRRSGEEFPALTMANTVLTETGDRVCMVFSFVDITARRRLEEELTALSLRDSLTGLYNRRGLLAMGEELLKSARRNEEEVSVFFVDLDCLKRVNDLYGHDEGDEVLRSVAGMLLSATRENDLACRIGGDEFALLVRKKSGSGVAPIRSRLTAVLDEHNRISSKPYRISISVGCSSGDPSCPDIITDLLLRADKAMYATKRKKKQECSDEDLLGCGGVTWREEADAPESN
jgi:diguanylate cyclase (GGDEF)-like protein